MFNLIDEFINLEYVQCLFNARTHQFQMLERKMQQFSDNILSLRGFLYLDEWYAMDRILQLLVQTRSLLQLLNQFRYFHLRLVRFYLQTTLPRLPRVLGLLSLILQFMHQRQINLPACNFLLHLPIFIRKPIQKLKILYLSLTTEVGSQDILQRKDLHTPPFHQLTIASQLLHFCVPCLLASHLDPDEMIDDLQIEWDRGSLRCWQLRCGQRQLVEELFVQPWKPTVRLQKDFEEQAIVFLLGRLVGMHASHQVLELPQQIIPQLHRPLPLCEDILPDHPQFGCQLVLPPLMDFPRKILKQLLEIDFYLALLATLLGRAHFMQDLIYVFVVMRVLFDLADDAQVDLLLIHIQNYYLQQQGKLEWSRINKCIIHIIGVRRFPRSGSACVPRRFISGLLLDQLPKDPFLSAREGSASQISRYSLIGYPASGISSAVPISRRMPSIGRYLSLAGSALCSICYFPLPKSRTAFSRWPALSDNPSIFRSRGQTGLASFVWLQNYDQS